MNLKWLKKIGKFITDIFDNVQDEFEERIDSIEDKVECWTSIGQKCHRLSNETIQICAETQKQRQAMIDFASEIQSTLESGFGKKNNDTSGEGRDGSHEGSTEPSLSDLLDTIKELTSGEKVKEAMGIATGLNEISKQCIEKSVELTDLMDEGMQQLPKFVQDALDRDLDIEERSRGIDGENDDDDDEDDDDDIEIAELIKGIDNDINDVVVCIDEIKHLHLQNALKVGLQAFVNLSDKARRAQKLFDAIQKYATDIQTITSSFSKDKMLDKDVFSTLREVTRAMMRCIKCSDIMKLAAVGAGKLLAVIIQLFDMTADRISTLWSAIAFAKDCMVKCMECVKKSTKLCFKAKKTTKDLIDRSVSLTKKLGEASKFNFDAISSLANDNEIEDALDVAGSIDDIIIECANTVVTMISSVNDGYKNIPDILTTEIEKEQEIENQSRSINIDDKQDVPDVDPDVNEVDEINRELDSSDMLSAASTGERGFTRLTTILEKCLTILTTLEGYSERSNRSIDSFLNVSWDLESATDKLLEMRQLTSLSTTMETIVQNLKRLLDAITNYMKTAFQKLTKLPRIQNIIDSGKDALENAMDAVENISDKLFGSKKKEDKE